MFRPGIFNETFDTVLFKPELRNAQLYRFACELIYCMIHEGEIRLSEPQGTDQFYIIKLIEENRSNRLRLERVINHLHVVQKPSGGKVLPLAESLANNLLSGYDFSCLDDKLEQKVRPGIVAVLAKQELEPLGKAQLLLQHLLQSGHASAEDQMAIGFWDRILHKGQRERENLGDVSHWNKSAQGEGLPFLAPTNLEPHRVFKEKSMGTCFKEMCSERRTSLWQRCLELLDALLDEKLPIEPTKEAALREAHTPRKYFNGRSPFYAARSFWEDHLPTGDYLFMKETLDSIYNEMVANTSNAGRRVFLPGDVSQHDQVEASRLVAEQCRMVGEQDCSRIAYLSAPAPWEWPDFLHAMQGMNEALLDTDFDRSRMEYIHAGTRQHQLLALQRLMAVINRRCAGAGIQMRINSDRSFTVLTAPRTQPESVVEMISASGESEITFTQQGECQHHA